ncbi:serine acetyltransferase [Undibacterium parvum]|uniref:Serine acetyltransferase n=3 Tax=Undibacterium TaxID=401469 RepID=A0A6M4AA70_9BURK|nr:serine acetyltransferase [Undibacterium parvum]QJQ07620.1 serine acetyltransferase [Undibacterium piscinae]
MLDRYKSFFSLRCDAFRLTGKFSLRSLLRNALLNRTFRPVVTMRLCQNASQSASLVRLLLPLFKLFHKFSTHNACMDFPWQTKIGAGLCITHGWGLVVSQGAIIGKNVTLFHGVTLGRSDKISVNGDRASGYPIIEDDVWIGPHAIIVGPITIGRGSRIAGGTFVTKNVEPYSLVGGNPSTILKSDCVPDVMNASPC